MKFSEKMLVQGVKVDRYFPGTIEKFVEYRYKGGLVWTAIGYKFVDVVFPKMCERSKKKGVKCETKNI